MNKPLLTIRNLSVSVKEKKNEHLIVDNVDLDVPEQSVVALVGGSGSGKSTTGLSVLRLLAPALNVKGGEIIYRGQDIMQMKKKELQKLRGGQIGMVFQDPLNAFNPVFTIGYQIGEVLTYHTALNQEKRRERIIELLELVGLPKAKQVMESYPHQLSGGMRQRAMIAQAIAADPKILIADEPTSNLDVTLQAKIMELFKKLQKRLDLTLLLITHDLGMVSHMADHVAVMTKGKIIERGEAETIMKNPHREYTSELIKAFEF